MELRIDTKDNTTIALINPAGATIDQALSDLRFSQSEKLLQEINKTLVENHVKKEALTKISVNCGPGSYTGIRVGVATANFLGLSLNIPVSSIECENRNKNFIGPVRAQYLREPFITKEKPRLT